MKNKRNVYGFIIILIVVAFGILLYQNFKISKQTNESGISGNVVNVIPKYSNIIIKTADGSKEITRFKPDIENNFRVSLPPGNYLLEPTFEGGQSPRPIGIPQTVNVEAGKYTEIKIVYEIGPR